MGKPRSVRERCENDRYDVRIHQDHAHSYRAHKYHGRHDHVRVRTYQRDRYACRNRDEAEQNIIHVHC